MAPNNTNRCSHFKMRIWKGRIQKKDLLDVLRLHSIPPAEIPSGLGFNGVFGVNIPGVFSAAAPTFSPGARYGGARWLPFGLRVTHGEFTPNAASFILLILRNVCTTPVEHADLVTASSISACRALRWRRKLLRAAHRNERVVPEANSLQAAIK